MGRNSPSRIKYKEPVDVKCRACNKTYQVSYDTWRRNGGENHEWYCRRCVMERLSDEDKEKRINKIKNSMAKLSDEEKQAITTKRLATLSKNRDEIKVKKQETWKNKSVDELNSISKKASENTKRVWNNMNEEDKSNRITKMHEGFDNWYSGLSEEEKEKRNTENLNNLNRWWDSLTLDQKQQLSEISRSRKEKKVVVKKSPYFDEDKFHQRFERQFSESHLYRDYHLEPNYSTTNNGVSHTWDYAVKDENNEVWMVIDLEDDFFNEILDDNRGLSIPDNVRCCIITEKNFGKCFDYMCKTLILNYGEYVERTFEMCRSMPFPYPHYDDKDLLGAYKSLCKIRCDDKSRIDISLNTRSGDRLIQHFHHSIWHDHRGGELSPYEAWQDDELLLQIIQNRIIYQNYLNPNKILQGFNIAKKAAKVSVFSAGRARMIVAKYLSEFDTVFDPFSGYSGRMIGTISVGKRYIGQDISLIHTNESNQIIEFLKGYGIKFDATISQADVFQSHGEYPCLFTCSPYSDKEQWEDVPVNQYTCDDWIDVCLSRFKCKRYVFVVDETAKYKDNIADVITNKSHFGSNSEYVIIIEGGNANI